MSPILNPTAPAFSPPVSIPRLASPFISTSAPTGAASEFNPGFFDSVDLALGADLPGSESSISETSEVAISLLGESLLKAVFHSPSSPYSPIDEDDDEYDDQFLASPPATASTPGSVRDIWSPTAVSCGTSEPLDSPFSSVLSLSDEDMYGASKVTAPSRNETWRVNENWAHDDDVYLDQDISPRPISIAPVAAEPPLKIGFDANLYNSALAMQQQLSWQHQVATHSSSNFTTFNPQMQAQPIIAPSLQFIHVPSVPPPKVGMAPLWPLISALHRNLSKSRPDLYGNLQPSAYFGPAS
ncbi:hypothetical protein CkaCkLH20_04345 [Colletotrichum karsti]|uniref:Uncharacterized protein n=1 Tax=Colletotrichum karsti TaxID=1095194 RepID=A0A9P6I7G3_9PEZI|nr:uncharacterized protein CkaCkLH20_04345 [Colletotrichum karsti]KAF9878307.1 hypothetical protein CkaCkLH20_04345 [Colletotrichum karsti]